MVSGIFYIMAACFFWSLVFVVPSFISGFSPVEIALGRFFFYGLISFLFILIKKRDLFSKAYFPLWKKACTLSLLSTVLAYTGSVYNILYAGPTIATLIFSMCPITITLAGNWHKKECSFKKLAAPLCFMVLGIILTKFSSFQSSSESLGYCLIGISCGLFGLASWTVYAVKNASFLKEQKELSLNDWALMMGTVTFFLVLAIGVFIIPFLDGWNKYVSPSSSLTQFLGFSFLLGSLSTWVSFFLWNHGSKKLPISLTGQLMIFEILFALFLIYFLEKKIPSPLEISGILLMISGVLLGFKVLKKPTEATIEP